jgi:deazaflavin-dependent oxidoreductase (nitroreductase family)
MPVLMLYSRGRRTGRTRENLLTFISHEDAFLIAGSNGGAVSSPGWYFNLKDEPRTQIRWRGKLIEVSARETRGQERETYWNMFKSSVDSYARYEARTSRLIPVLVLAPIKAN